MGFAVFIFLVVEVALVFFIVKYRLGAPSERRRRPEIRGHLNLELAWTVVPVLILIAIAVFTFYDSPASRTFPQPEPPGRSSA